MISKQTLFYNIIKLDIPSSSNDDINLMSVYQDKKIYVKINKYTC
jgi:hypothetical protein